MISKLSCFERVRFLFVLLLLVTFNVKADHYYGGYISYTHINGFKYEVTVVTYADNSKVNSDRDSVIVICELPLITPSPSIFKKVSSN